MLQEGHGLFCVVGKEMRGAMGTLLQDIKIASRMMIKSPGFSLVVVLTLGLGIGANTAIFSVVDAVLLRPLAYKDSAALVDVWGKIENQGIPRLAASEPEYWDLRNHQQSFSEVGAYTLGNGANLTSNDAPPMQVSAPAATATLFEILGVQTELGRTFTEDEDQPGHDHEALLSFALWKSLFGGDPQIVGKSMQLDGQPYTIVGVLRKDFSLGGKQDLWVPLGLDRMKPQDRGSHYLTMMARLKPGVTLAQASAEMDRFAAQLERENPNNYLAGSGWGMFVVPLKEQIVGRIRPALLVLLGAVAFVLLIACVNVANLLLTRASAREKELSIRTAMGAGRARIVRQLLTESMVYAVAGGTLGLCIAYWGVYALHALVPDNIPRMGEVSVDPLVLGFTLGISLLTGIIFGLAPAWQVGRTSLHGTLKETGQSTSAARGTRRLRGALVVSEMALAVLLLVGAGLVIRSFQRLMEVNPGFQPQHLLSMKLSPPAKAYPDGAPLQTFYQRVLDGVKTIPGVQSAGAISELPMSDSYSSGSTFFEQTSATDLQRYAPMSNLPFTEIDYRTIVPGYFQAMQIPLVRGRFLSEADTSDAPRGYGCGPGFREPLLAERGSYRETHCRSAYPQVQSALASMVHGGRRRRPRETLRAGRRRARAGLFPADSTLFCEDHVSCRAHEPRTGQCDERHPPTGARCRQEHAHLRGQHHGPVALEFRRSAATEFDTACGVRRDCAGACRRRNLRSDGLHRYAAHA